MKIYKTLPNGIRIVEYDESLAPAIADMWNRSGEGWGGQFGNGIWTTEHVIAQQAAGAYFNIYIAMKGDEAVGYCNLERYYKDENTAYIHLLNVRPDYHGKGVGKDLVLLCVNKTIALGMPRLDIHTWPGNTKAVPLYKKCGFQWEDRSDTTHLSNFIPTVLATDLFKNFFETADWYSDSTRKIEIKPDGRKVNKFEFFEYEWEKDGFNLLVGFEKTGRRIRLIETNDYKIELTADNHNLAFGLDYYCRFEVVNKTGKQLDVTIDAKNDGVISFDGSWSESVTDKAVFERQFYIDAITREQDEMRVHPCVLADVHINGKHVEFGLGIEPKFPIEVELYEKRLFAEPGTTEDVYINIKNNLLHDATVKFTLPDNDLTHFEQSEFEIKLAAGKNTSYNTRAIVIACGYAALPVTYVIDVDSNSENIKQQQLITGEREHCKTVSVTRPLHLVNQGLTGSFAFETNKSFGAADGLWRLRLNKQDNTVNFERLIKSGHCHFTISKLGQPYDDEFNIMEPADVRILNIGTFTRLEADFKSGKFKGVVLTEIYEFNSNGILKRHHRVTNTGQKPLNLSLQTEYFTSVGKRAVLHYDGDFHELADDMIYGFDSFSFEKIDENWVFDKNPENPAGSYWPKEYQPTIIWGDLLKFTCPIGMLDPKQSFETGAFGYMCDVFKDYRDFRNYVLGICDETIPVARNHLEIITNKGNPVLAHGSETNAGDLELTIRNNRLKSWTGCISVSSPDDLFAGVLQDNFNDEMQPETTITVPVATAKAGIGITDFSLNLSGFEKKAQRALFVADSTQIISKVYDNILTVTNGNLRFSVAPDNSDAMYSLEYGDTEWFYSRYPASEPYSWWNPFIGGLKTFLQRMQNSLVLREKITACFTSETDTLGNTWTGIRADVIIENNDEYKGMCYSQYYLTLPGVPVVCHFMKLENRTGCYKDAELYSMLFVSGKEGLPETIAEMETDDRTKYRLRLCDDGHEMYYDRLISFSRDGEIKRPEKLYVFKDSARDRGTSLFEYDINIAFCDYNMKSRLPDGGCYTTKPIFCILSEKELSLENLIDLSKIEYAY